LPKPISAKHIECNQAEALGFNILNSHSYLKFSL